MERGGLFALGDTGNRIELLDGSLLVSPAPTKRHQRISFRLAGALDGPTTENTEVVLVGEIVSPDSAAADCLIKMQFYAAAQIPAYLVVETGSAGSLTLRLYHLEGSHYFEVGVAGAGEVLSVGEPFPFVLDSATLLGR